MHFPLHAVFVALPLEGEAMWQFQALQEVLKPFEEFLRFQHPQSPHLTLQYWHVLMEIEYHQVIPQCEKLAARTAPFTLHVTEASTLGDRVLILEVAFSEELARLKKAAPWPSDREFHPHITLARINHANRFAVHRKKIFKALEDCAFAVPIDRLRLYAEIDGIKQTPLQEFFFSTP